MKMNSPDPVHGLTAENLLAVFPVALQRDQPSAALADVTARLLARRPEEIERLRIYPAIDRLDEGLLDILAYDFKVDWWDANYSLEEKRRTLKDSWRVHKLLGTKAAVEMAISAIYPQTTVQEWFEYGGRPYHFKLQLDLTGTFWTEERPRRILERVNFYKSLRLRIPIANPAILRTNPHCPVFSFRQFTDATSADRTGCSRKINRKVERAYG